MGKYKERREVLDTDGKIPGIDEGNVFPMGATSVPRSHELRYFCFNCHNYYKQGQLKSKEGILHCPKCAGRQFSVNFG